MRDRGRGREGRKRERDGQTDSENGVLELNVCVSESQ